MAEGRVVVQFIGRDQGAKASAEALASTLDLIEGLTSDLTKSQKKLNQETSNGIATTQHQAAAARDLQKVAQGALQTQQQQEKLNQQSFRTKQQELKVTQQAVQLTGQQAKAEQDVQRAAALGIRTQQESLKLEQQASQLKSKQAIDQERLNQELSKTQASEAKITAERAKANQQVSKAKQQSAKVSQEEAKLSGIQAKNAQTAAVAEKKSAAESLKVAQEQEKLDATIATNKRRVRAETFKTQQQEERLTQQQGKTEAARAIAQIKQSQTQLTAEQKVQQERERTAQFSLKTSAQVAKNEQQAATFAQKAATDQAVAQEKISQAKFKTQATEVKLTAQQSAVQQKAATDQAISQEKISQAKVKTAQQEQKLATQQATAQQNAVTGQLIAEQKVGAEKLKVAQQTEKLEATRQANTAKAIQTELTNEQKLSQEKLRTTQQEIKLEQTSALGQQKFQTQKLADEERINREREKTNQTTLKTQQQVASGEQKLTQEQERTAQQTLKTQQQQVKLTQQTATAEQKVAQESLKTRQQEQKLVDQSADAQQKRQNNTLVGEQRINQEKLKSQRIEQSIAQQADKAEQSKAQRAAQFQQQQQFTGAKNTIALQSAESKKANQDILQGIQQQIKAGELEQKTKLGLIKATENQAASEIRLGTLRDTQATKQQKNAISISREEDKRRQAEEKFQSGQTQKAAAFTQRQQFLGDKNALSLSSQQNRESDRQAISSLNLQTKTRLDLIKVTENQAKSQTNLATLQVTNANKVLVSNEKVRQSEEQTTRARQKTQNEQISFEKTQAQKVERFQQQQQFTGAKNTISLQSAESKKANQEILQGIQQQVAASNLEAKSKLNVLNITTAQAKSEIQLGTLRDTQATKQQKNIISIAREEDKRANQQKAFEQTQAQRTERFQTLQQFTGQKNALTLQATQNREADRQALSTLNLETKGKLNLIKVTENQAKSESNLSTLQATNANKVLVSNERLRQSEEQTTRTRQKTQQQQQAFQSDQARRTNQFNQNQAQRAERFQSQQQFLGASNAIKLESAESKKANREILQSIQQQVAASNLEAKAKLNVLNITTAQQKAEIQTGTLQDKRVAQQQKFTVSLAREEDKRRQQEEKFQTDQTRKAERFQQQQQLFAQKGALSVQSQKNRENDRQAISTLNLQTKTKLDLIKTTDAQAKSETNLATLHVTNANKVLASNERVKQSEEQTFRARQKTQNDQLAFERTQTQKAERFQSLQQFTGAKNTIAIQSAESKKANQEVLQGIQQQIAAGNLEAKNKLNQLKVTEKEATLEVKLGTLRETQAAKQQRNITTQAKLEDSRANQQKAFDQQQFQRAERFQQQQQFNTSKNVLSLASQQNRESDRQILSGIQQQIKAEELQAKGKLNLIKITEGQESSVLRLAKLQSNLATAQEVNANKAAKSQETLKQSIEATARSQQKTQNQQQAFDLSQSQKVQRFQQQQQFAGAKGELSLQSQQNREADRQVFASLKQQITLQKELDRQTEQSAKVARQNAAFQQKSEENAAKAKLNLAQKEEKFQTDQARRAEQFQQRQQLSNQKGALSLQSQQNLADLKLQTRAKLDLIKTTDSQAKSELNLATLQVTNANKVLMSNERVRQSEEQTARARQKTQNDQIAFDQKRVQKAERFQQQQQLFDQKGALSLQSQQNRETDRKALASLRLQQQQIKGEQDLAQKSETHQQRMLKLTANRENADKLSLARVTNLNEAAFQKREQSATAFNLKLMQMDDKRAAGLQVLNNKVQVSDARRQQQLGAIAFREQNQQERQAAFQQRSRVNEGSATTRLAGTLGINVKAAEDFAKGMDLTAAATNTAIKRLVELQAVNSTTKERFAILRQELGTTRDQFLQLEAAARKAAQVKVQRAEGTAGISGSVQLAQVSGKSLTQAQQFAGSLGLTSDKAAAAVQRIKELDAVSASSAQKFVILNRELGVSKTQFEALDRASRQSKEGLQMIAAGAGVVAAGIGAIAVKGVQDFAQFDKSIRTLGVVTESSGTKQLAGLRTEVERLGGATTKTPQEIANVAVELGKAGFTATQTKEALAGVVQSSEATGEGLARTGEVIGATLNQFGLKAKDSIKIADLLTQASNVSAAGTNDLGEALSYVGAQAKASDQSVEDTITTLALLANAGIKGSSAGTGLAEALRRLKLASASATTELTDLKSRGSKNAVAAFNRLDAEVRNADGSLKPFPEILQKIKANLGSLDTVNQDLLMNALFGVQGGRVIQTLLNQTDEQISQVTSKMDTYAGASARASAEMTKGLPGGLAIFNSSVALVSQKVGEFVAQGVTPIVQGANLLMQTFLNLPAPIQTGLLAMSEFVGVLAAATAAIAAYNLANGANITQKVIEAAVTVKSTIANAGNTAALIANTASKVANAGAGKVLLGSKTAETAATTANTAAIAANTGAQAASGAGIAKVVASKGLLGGALAILTGGFKAVTAGVISFIGGLLPAAPLLLAAGTAAAALYSVVDTFKAIKGAAEPTVKATDDLKKKLEELNKTKVNIGNGLEVAKTDVDRYRESLNPLQQALEVTRENLSFIPGVVTATEAAFNDSKIAMGDLVGELEGVTQSYQKFILSNDRSKESIDKQRSALEAAKAAIAASKPVDEAGTAAKKQYTKAIENALAQLGRIEGASQKAAAGTKQAAAADRDAAQAADTKAEALKKAREAEKLAAERGFEKEQTKRQRGFDDESTKRQQQFSDAATKRQQQFSDQAARRQQQFDDARTKREQAFQDQQESREEAFSQAKEKREQAFQARQQKLDSAHQARKQAAESAFKAKQDQASRDFQTQQQQQEADFKKQQQAEEKAFKDAQAARQKEQQRAFTDANQQLELEGARGIGSDNLEQLERSQKILQAVDNLQFDGLQQLGAQDIAGLAKSIAGVTGRVDTEEELTAAKEAAAAIEAKLKEAQQAAEQERERVFQEEQRTVEEEFKAAQKEAEVAFQEEQRAAETAFQDQQRAADTAHEQQKQKAQEAFKATEQATESAFKQQQQESERSFKESEQEAERAFKEAEQAKERDFKQSEEEKERQFKQEELEKERAFKDEERLKEQQFKDAERAKDEASAERVKKILESTKIPAPAAPAPTPTATPTPAKPPGRRFGGNILPSQPYLVGESGPELIWPSMPGYVVTASKTARLLNQIGQIQNVQPLPSGMNRRSREERLLGSINRKLDRLGSTGGDVRMTNHFSNHFSGQPSQAVSQEGRSVAEDTYSALGRVMRELEWRQRWRSN